MSKIQLIPRTLADCITISSTASHMADIKPCLFTVELFPVGAGTHALTLAHLEKYAFRPHLLLLIEMLRSFFVFVFYSVRLRKPQAIC